MRNWWDESLWGSPGQTLVLGSANGFFTSWSISASPFKLCLIYFLGPHFMETLVLIPDVSSVGQRMNGKVILGRKCLGTMFWGETLAHTKQ